MMRQQYGRYTDQQTRSDETASNAGFVSEMGNTRRDFLNRKYEDDLSNARIWRRFTVIASVTGVVIMFLGVLGGGIIGIVAGALFGGLVGGMSTLVGIITNIFLHLVYNPAKKADEQLEHTCTLIAEEERREEQHREDLQLLERLDEADRKEYIKRRLFSHIPSAKPPPAEGANVKASRRSRRQRNP